MSEIGIVVTPDGMMLIILFAFGVGYNWFVAELDSRQRGYTAFLVVGGVLVTIGGFAFLEGFEAGCHALVCFAASGLPMIVGSVWRYIRAREAEEREAWGRARGAHEAQD